MAKTVGIGHQDYEKVIVNQIFYIDKTSFIREWWESADEVTLITRPRRFGKTLNMSMLEKFFSVKYAGRSELFDGLSIWQDEKYRSLQGTYPVLFLSFAGIKDTSYESARENICRMIEEQYNKHDFLLEGNLLNEKEKAFYQKVTADMPEATAAVALRSLADFLSRYYKKKVIILLDEYDTPMQEAYVSGYWQEIVAFMRSLFNYTFKTNSFLERALMTGITRISKESIFSDLNNLEVVTMTSKKYMDSFGFTEDEVFAALEEYGLSEQKQKVKYWYDGFTFGNTTDIYNPWSIVNFLDKRDIGTYWVNSSSNSLVGKLVREGSPEIKITMEKLLRGDVFYTRLDDQIVFNQLEQDDEAVWSLFLASGYLKIAHYEFDTEGREANYALKLTNMEVLMMFEHLISGWFGRCRGVNNGFLQALLADDVKAMNLYMNKVTTQMFSYFDTGRNPSGEEPERFYHGFVLGLMVELADRYVITSNRESGFGRYDVMMEPKQVRRTWGSGVSTKNGDDKNDIASDKDTGDVMLDAIIIEFKVQDTDEKELSDTVREALLQIEKKNYQANLIAKGITEERIRRYGFAFCGKKVLIGGGRIVD